MAEDMPGGRPTSSLTIVDGSHVFAYWKLVLEGLRFLVHDSESQVASLRHEYAFLSFFTFAHHLTDHLKHGGSEDARRVVNAIVDSSVPLARCREVANTTKHFEINRGSDLGKRRPSVGSPNIMVMGFDATGRLQVGPTRYQLRFADGSTCDALDLATAVVLAWREAGLGVNEEFLTELGIDESKFVVRERPTDE